MYELITEATREEYEAFIQSHPQGHFCQSHLWGKQKTAWRFQAVAVRGDDGRIKGSKAEAAVAAYGESAIYPPKWVSARYRAVLTKDSGQWHIRSLALIEELTQ